MFEKIGGFVKLAVLVSLILAVTPVPGSAGVSYILPCDYRVETVAVKESGATTSTYKESVFDTAYVGVLKDHSGYEGDNPVYRLIYHRVWTQFDISELASSKITGVSFKVHNDGSATDKKIASLRYTSFEPAETGGHILKGQHDFPPNRYAGGLEWEIGSAWNPEVDFFEPDWDSHKRCDGAGNCRSLVDDLQAHIDTEKSWFAVEFSKDSDVVESFSDLINLRLSDPDSFDPASVYMKVDTDDVLVLFVPMNLGSGSDGGETSPLTCQPINFATGNKYKRESDLVINGPGLPLTYTRHYNSQSKHDGILGHGWTGTFSERLTLNGGGMTAIRDDGTEIHFGKMILREADGREVHFTDDGSGKYVSGLGQAREIKRLGTGWKLTEPDRKVLEFDGQGKLTKTTDRNGNTQTLEYDAAGEKLISVTDNYGRKLEFDYTDGHLTRLYYCHIKLVPKDGQLEELYAPADWFDYEYDGGNLTFVRKPDGQTRRYEYKDHRDPHNLTRIIDENGESANYEYDDQDRAVASERIGGTDHVTVTYEDGLTRTITDSQGKQTRYEIQTVNGVGRVKSSSGSCGSCPGSTGAQYALNAKGQTETRTDPLGNVTTYTYDEQGNVVTKTEAKNKPEETRTTTYTYDSNLVTSVTRKSVSKPTEDIRTSFDYDTAGNLTKVTETGFSRDTLVTRTTSIKYEGDPGQITSIDGPRTDDTVRFEYYSNENGNGLDRGMLKKIINPLGHETVFSDYDALGNPGKITDANDVETTFAHDAAGRMLSKSVGGLETRFEYDAAGNLSALTLPGERKITYTYTDAGQVERIRDNLGNYVHRTYDSRGNRIREEIHDKGGTSRKYTDFGFDDLSRLQKITYPGDHSETAEYDGNHNLTGTADVRGKRTGYAYDSLDRLTVITQPGNTVTAFGYDSHDNLVKVTDAEENVTEYAYDDFGQVVSVKSPDSGAETYVYDAASNVVSRKDGRGITVEYAYDALNRLTNVIFSETSQITYEYDKGTNGTGRLSSMTDLAGKTDYAYNLQGQLTQETRTSGGNTFVTKYDYDLKTGDLSGITYPDGPEITYRRDGSGQITTVSADRTDVVRLVSHLPFGPVSGMTFGNGLKTDRTHDKRYLLTQSETSSVADYQYVRDAAGNVLTVSGVGTPDAPSKGKTDSEHEGNRLMRSTGGKAASYAYDGHGNIVSDGTSIFEYDQNNRLAKVTQGETVLGEYSYDGQGRRVRKLASGVVTLYHYDHAGNLIAETDGNGTLVRAYIYVNGERVAMKVYGDQAGMCYFLNDHLGTPQKVVNSSGNVVWEAAYLPFGEAQIITETVTNNFRFPGQYFDAETGLHYNYLRYYDPKTGRYLTPDPIGQAGGTNLYPYALNNPVNFVDPYGESPALAGFLIVTGAYYLLTNPDAANAPDPCDNIYDSYGAEKIFGEGAVDIVMLGILSKVFKLLNASKKPLLPDSYWINKKASTQVTPGTRTVNIPNKPSSTGGTYHSTTHYDEYGRQIGQTHQTNHGYSNPGGEHYHPNPHHHRRDPVTGEKLKDPNTGSRTWSGLFGN